MTYSTFPVRATALVLISGLTACHSPTTEFAIDFEQAPDLDYWKAETEGPSPELSLVEGALDIDASGGATIWFVEKLHAPIAIEYTAYVVSADGPNDRVSDLNCFWMAEDPRCAENIFSCADTVRTGRFGDYHQLRTYYVGYGGHNNTKTRFRRYTGTGERPLLPTHDLAAPHLIAANQEIKVRIEVFTDRTTYAVNGEILFEYQDKEPYLAGWFAFRTVRNHLRVKDFFVKQLKD